MDAEVDQPARGAGGVMVISAWSTGKDGRLVARVTMTARPGDAGESEVRVVATPQELHELMDGWLARLQE